MHPARRCLFAPLLALLTFVAGCSAPAAPPQPVAQSVAPAPSLARERVDALRALCESFRAERKIIGMSVAVLQDGAVLFDEGFGVADRESGRTPDSETLFRLGSISKPVTAGIAMQLVEAGKLDLDADLGTYVPELREKLPKMTLRQVLSHTAGIRHYQPGKIDNSTRHVTTSEALALFVDDPLLFAPGTKYSYSTHGYTLVVAAIEHASGRDFVSLARERIRDQGLPSLDCELPTDDKPGRSSLYHKLPSGEIERQGPREDNSWKFGGGGFESTALDLARFGQAMLEPRLVGTATRDAMWRPTRLADGTESNYGLGWRLTEDHSAVYHTGSQQGAHAALWIVPAERLVIAVMSNTLEGGAPGLAPLVRKAIEGG